MEDGEEGEGKRCYFFNNNNNNNNNNNSSYCLEHNEIQEKAWRIQAEMCTKRKLHN
jgi:hypothetical protein